MHVEQRQKAERLLAERGVERALFAHPASVTWLSGFSLPIQVGPSPFAGGPPLVGFAGGEFTLIVTDIYDTSAVTLPVLAYPGNTVDTPIRSASNLARLVEEFTGQAGPSAQWGIEARHLPASLLPASTRPIDDWLAPLRMVKTAEELAKLRRAFALGDLAHAAARAATRAGAREIDVWVAAHGAAQQAAGQRVAFGNDCVVSYRENNVGGWPGDLPLREGDSLMVDLSTRVDGYWSDSCASYYAGAPSERQRAMHRTAAEALALGIRLARPGVHANEIDRQLRQFVAQAGYPVYSHHTGDGIGAMPHELPRIVPYDDTPLAPGMVLMLEPGIYFPREAAVRLEDALLVTSDGCEVLTRHDKGLPA